MKKRLLILIFAAVIAIPLITMIALRPSADDVTYYNISSYQDLVDNKSHYSDSNAVFRLTQDITVTGDGSGARADFSATFDGQGHTVYNCQGAFLYLIKKKDLIPDSIPVIGIADDVAVLGLALKLVEQDVQAYREWRDANK